MTTVINTEPLTAILPNGHRKYGYIMWNIFEVLQIDVARNITRVNISKKARATRSLLKVLRKCICMRIMIIIVFPKIPKTAIISLVKRSTHDSNSSYSPLPGLWHSKLVTLFVTISAYLDQAALVLMFSNEVDSLEVHTSTVWNVKFDVSLASFKVHFFLHRPVNLLIVFIVHLLHFRLHQQTDHVCYTWAAGSFKTGMIDERCMVRITEEWGYAWDATFE